MGPAPQLLASFPCRPTSSAMLCSNHTTSHVTSLGPKLRTLSVFVFSACGNLENTLLRGALRARMCVGGLLLSSVYPFFCPCRWFSPLAVVFAIVLLLAFQGLFKLL